MRSKLAALTKRLKSEACRGAFGYSGTGLLPEIRLESAAIDGAASRLPRKRGGVSVLQFGEERAAT